MNHTEFDRLMAGLAEMGRPQSPGTILLGRLVIVAGKSATALAEPLGMKASAILVRVGRLRRQIKHLQDAEAECRPPAFPVVGEALLEDAHAVYDAAGQQYRGDEAEDAYRSPDWWSPSFHAERTGFADALSACIAGEVRRLNLGL